MPVFYLEFSQKAPWRVVMLLLQLVLHVCVCCVWLCVLCRVVCRFGCWLAGCHPSVLQAPLPQTPDAGEELQHQGQVRNTRGTSCTDGGEDDTDDECFPLLSASSGCWMRFCRNWFTWCKRKSVWVGLCNILRTHTCTKILWHSGCTPTRSSQICSHTHTHAHTHILCTRKRTLVTV